MEIILISILFALLGTIIFSFVGLVPGTDETATLAPLTLVLVISGVPPEALLSWFIASITAMQMTNSVPVSIGGIPGSTMAVPLLPACNALRRLGAPHIALKKMAS